jgi:hypothetical protein
LTLALFTLGHAELVDAAPALWRVDHNVTVVVVDLVGIRGLALVQRVAGAALFGEIRRVDFAASVCRHGHRLPVVSGH